MKNFFLVSLFSIVGSLASAQDSVVSAKIESKDKVITSILVDVGPCYIDTNTSNHADKFEISFPISLRESGQTWLESRGEIVSGSLATYDRIVTKDYTRTIYPTIWTRHSERMTLCGQVRDSYVKNMELAKQFFSRAQP